MKDKGKIANNLKLFRLQKGQMTQQQLADKAQVTRQTIIAIEANRYSPSLKLAFKIARVFDAKIEDIFGYEE